MKGIPPELDRLMWTVAEKENSAAADEFLARYPLYREELRRRQQALSGLKSGRPNSGRESKPIPRFTPRESRPLPPNPRQVAAVSGLVLAAIAVASYTVTTMVSPVPRRVVVQPAPHVDLGPIDSGPKVVLSPPEVKNPVADPTREVPPTKEAEPSKLLRPQSLVVKNAKLPDVLRLLATQSGVKLVMPPQMPEPVISVEYHDMTPEEMLKDLASQYRFSAFDQGDGSVLVIPAVDTNPQPGNSAVKRVGI